MRVQKYRETLRRTRTTYGWHAMLGLVFFGLVAGFAKLNPRNVAWITFKDTRASWIGWQFFATDNWRWPLGASPTYGWNGLNSIVYSDSWPIIAILLKALRLEAFQVGQFMGLAWLGSSILLFVGCAKVFGILRVSRLNSLLGSILVASTPLFWWLHRWYFAISGGVVLIVWAIYLYLRDVRRAKYSIQAWILLLVIAVGTNMYLCAMLIPIAGASLLRNALGRSDWWYRIPGLSVVTGLALLGSMYVFGYFVMPVTSASTGRYGVYTANLLGLIDANKSSRLLPDLPSMQFQYEPTSIGIGALLLLVSFFFATPPSRYLSSVRRMLRRNWLFASVIVGMFMFAVSHVVTIGTRMLLIPLPGRVIHLLSVFQSSTRFIWPLVVTLAIVAVVLVSRFARYATQILLIALVVQVVDISHELRSVAQRADGMQSVVAYDSPFWESVPSEYRQLSLHYAENIRTGWDECSLAAVRTKRIANCAYLSRAPGFAPINSAQDELLLSGNPDPHVVYWLTFGWIVNHERQLRELYGNGQHGLAFFKPNSVSAKEFIMLFPFCDRFADCEFLASRRVSVDEAISISG